MRRPRQRRQPEHRLIWSRRSRITPSRSAHGQISSSSRSKMSMHGLGDQGARDDLVGAARRDAGQRRRARRRTSRPAWGSTRAARRSGSVRGTSGAVAGRRRAADPGQRAERLRRRGRLVGRARRAAGCPASRAISARIWRRSCADRLLVGRRRRRSTARASRAAPSGSDQATSGASSAPPAISSEPPPMSKTASRPADQPNQRRTARKVSRASSSPDEHRRSRTPVRSWTWSSTSSAVAGVAHRRGREAEDVLAALVLGDHAAPRR